jgi:putative oxidoreductase
LLSRLASLPLIVVMTVAILTAKSDALHGIADLLGFEEWTYIVLAVWIAVAGPGPLSLDRLVQQLLRKSSRSTPESTSRIVAT